MHCDSSIANVQPHSALRDLRLEMRDRLCFMNARPYLSMTEKQTMPELHDSVYRCPYFDNTIHMTLYANAQVQRSESNCTIMDLSAYHREKPEYSQ